MRSCLVMAVLAAGIAGCSDDDSNDADGQRAYVATGAFVGGEDAAFLCEGLDESTFEGCSGFRVMLPASTTDVLRDAGVALRDSDGGPRADRVTLRFEDLTYHTEFPFLRADRVAVVETEERTPHEVLVGEGELQPADPLETGDADRLQAELDRMAGEISPAGTIYIWSYARNADGSRDGYLDADSGLEGVQSFAVFTMLPLTDADRDLLTSTLSGEISIRSWASFAD